MQQIIQSFKTGLTTLEEVPAPQPDTGQVLIKTMRSLVSLGTERMLVEFGKSNLIQKARQQPERVREVLDKIKLEGLIPTLEAVYNKLEQPLPLGYCNSGRVVGIGEGVNDFKIGDRVASNGNHAEYVVVPKNLVAHIPDNVSYEDASFTVVGAIGLQGIRLCQPLLGETIAVLGLGLIGLMTAQLLMANGCNVVGIDVDDAKLDIASKKGIATINPLKADIVKAVLAHTAGTGADGVIITASSKSGNIIGQAAQMSRKRGRIVLVGVIDLNINRNDFYEKELTFQVSCSYGPGRYDENYEHSGQDYPLAYVRWTEKRNFEAVLNAISTGQLNVNELISERVSIADFRKIYDNIGDKKSIASIIEYTEIGNDATTIALNPTGHHAKGSGIGIIGAGNFTKMTMLPALKHAKAQIVSIASKSGLTGTTLARKFGIGSSTTDYHGIIDSPDVDLVMITTRHNEHAQMVVESLNAGKHVFVEKPLAIHPEDLKRISNAYTGKQLLAVGFNRRFSPHSQKVKELFGESPMNVVATMNAGFIPPNSWVQDMATGGGRILGEACHYIDLISYFTGSEVTSVCMNALGIWPKENTDNATLLLKYKNGSTGVINYFSNGSKAYPKERIEVYSLDRTAVIDNFRVTSAYGFKSFSKMKTNIEKGHKEQFALLVKRIKEGGEDLIPFNSIVNTTKACFAGLESLKLNRWIEIE